jgi:SNF2 family DNA or RNA helicase
MIGNDVDLSSIQDNLITNHKANYEKYKEKLEELDVTKKEYHMLKTKYTTMMTESKYMFTILEKMKSPELITDEECTICISQIEEPTLTKCGHLFCNQCIKSWLTKKTICPLCKINLSGQDLLCIIPNNNISNISNSMIDKYGSKLGKLISMIQELLKIKETRIIVFSQWDIMLNLISKTLVENDISNMIVKGNAMCKNSAIRKFKNKTEEKNDNDNRVIMLSLKNSASGTNLTEATHIFFIEPINTSKEECHLIEKQAIARACRIGQTNQVKIIRILIENSIEETIYRMNYL